MSDSVDPVGQSVDDSSNVVVDHNDIEANTQQEEADKYVPVEEPNSTEPTPEAPNATAVDNGEETTPEVMANPVQVEATGVAAVGENQESAIAEDEWQPNDRSRDPMVVLGRNIIRCVRSPLGYCSLIFFSIAICALSVTFFVYAIISLVRTSNNEQKDLCHRSSAWVYVLVHLILGGFIYQQGEDKGDNDVEKLGKACWNLIKYLTILGLMSWGCYELWGISCVDQLKDKLLYIILQIYVIVDIIAVGCSCCVMWSICCFTMCYKSYSRRRAHGDSEQRPLRNDTDGAAEPTVHEATPTTEVPSDQATAVVLEV